MHLESDAGERVFTHANGRERDGDDTMVARTRSRRSTHSNNAHADELRAQAHEIGENVKALAATAGAAVTDRLGPVEQYVQEKPVKALLIAAGAGAVLGLLFLRRG
jgi:ElaB/YqjD/DUF883 family membrane-anchored ribosome-binding protein